MQHNSPEYPSSPSQSDKIQRGAVDNTASPDTVRNLLEKCKHLDVLERTVEIGEQVGHGGSSDLFIGNLKLANGNFLKVAVKKLRVYALRHGNHEKALVRELYIWSKLHHPRILRLEGLYINAGYPHLISPWMTNGTALSYLERNPSADLVHLVTGIAEGIAYLHSRKIVHSDVKPDNVLVDDEEEPLLCDFGISRMLEKSPTYPVSNTTTSSGVTGTIRYMSKELFREGASHTEPSDIWAFGMTVYTFLVRQQPYNNLRTEAQVLLAIVDGNLPSWPEDIGTWTIANQCLSRMCQRCWDEESIRPDIGTLLRELRQVHGRARPVDPEAIRGEQLLESQPSGTVSADESLPRRKFEATGTAHHLSSDRLRCDFIVDGYRMTFDASTSLGLPQFSSKPARIFYDDTDELTGTQGYSGFIGIDSYTLTLDNGTIIVGYLDALHQEGMTRILGSGIWAGT